MNTVHWIWDELESGPAYAGPGNPVGPRVLSTRRLRRPCASRHPDPGRGRDPAVCLETAGLGIFTGLQPIVYVPIVRAAELSEWHRLLWTAIGAAMSADHYWLTEWLPHITLAMGDVDGANLGRVVEVLGGRNFSWQIRVDNLAFIDAGYEGQRLALHLELGG